MLTKPLAIALTSACLMAAGGGAYLASRQSSRAAEPAVQAQLSAAAPAVTQGVTPVHAVDETEAIVSPPLEPPAPRVEPVAPAPRPRAAASAPAAQPRREPAPAPARQSAPEVTRAQGTAPAPPPGLERTWPSRSGSPAGESIAAAPEVRQPLTGLPPSSPTASLPAVEPQRMVEELVVSAGSVIGLQIDSGISSETANLEDRVEARVTRDVAVGGDVAIPAGARALGSVTLVERGGKVRERARLGVRFHTLVLADGTTIPIQTDAVFREGHSPAGESAAKIGGAAIGGAILGGILGGTRGAVLGGSAGAAGGTAAVMAGDRNPAALPAGATVTVRLTSPATVTVER